MKLSGIFLIAVLLVGANNAKPEKENVQIRARRTNSNSQENVQQMGGSNSNEQSKIQQMGRRSEEFNRPGVLRRANTNSQIGVQQYGSGNSNRQESVQQHTRRANMNSQSYVQQMGGSNSNEQSQIQQMGRGLDGRAKPILGRRANSNSQSGIQQQGRGNSNSQTGVMQSGRRQSGEYIPIDVECPPRLASVLCNRRMISPRMGNSNSQSGVQQKGRGNSNSQSDVMQYGRRTVSARMGNSNVQKQVQQQGGSNSNEQSGIQQQGRRAWPYEECPPFIDPNTCMRRMISARMSEPQMPGRRFSMAPELNTQYQIGGGYEPLQPPVLWGGPDAYITNSEYGIEGVDTTSYPELTLPQQGGLLASVYGSYQQGLGGSPSWGGSPWDTVVPEYDGYGLGYGSSLAYGSLGGQYQQPSGLGYTQAQSLGGQYQQPSGLGYMQTQSPYGQAQVFG